jgi:hypothetical protein
MDAKENLVPRRLIPLIAFCDMDGYARSAESALGPSGLVPRWIGDEFLLMARDPDAGLRALLNARSVLGAYLARTGAAAPGAAGGSGSLGIQAHVG